MTELLATTVKDLRRYSRDPLALIMWLAIPLVIGSLLVLMSGGSGAPSPTVHLLIADEDDTFASRLLLAALSQSQMDFVRTEMVDLATGRRRIDRGEASALLILPEGFSEAIVKEQPTQLDLVTNPAQRLAPGIAEELLSLLRDAVFYAHRLFGPEIRQMVTGPEEDRDAFHDETVAEMSVNIHRKVMRFQDYLDPPVIQLETVISTKQVAEELPDSIPFSFYFLPGMLMMGLLLAAQGLSGDIWRERDAGVLRRVLTTPLGVSRFLAGKIAAGAVALALITSVVLSFGFWYFELPWLRLPLAWIWSIGIGILLVGLMLPLQVLASNRRGASVLSFVIVFPLMMLGGSMFPFELMPDWLANVGRYTPNGWAVEQLKAILLAREGPLPLATAFMVLLTVTLSFFAVAVYRIVRVFARH